MKPPYVLALLAAAAAGTLAPVLTAGVLAQSSTRPDTQPATHATEPAVAEPPAEAVALLRQLDDADYARREQAEQALLALLLAEPALTDWLTNAARSQASPEVRTRLASILSELEEQRLLGATRITLDVRQVHPRQLVAEFSRQAGVNFDYWPQDPWEGGGASAGMVSLELKGVPFWEAMRRVSEVTGLTPVEHQTPRAGGMVLSLNGQPLASPPTAYHGAFAVQLRRLHRSQNAQVELGVGPDGRIAGNANNGSSLTLEMRMLMEPKIRLSGNATQPIIEEALDESGRSLLPSDDPRFNGGGGGGRGWANPESAWSVQASVMLDAKAATQSRAIARLRGRFEAEVATQTTTLEVKFAELLDVRKLRDGDRAALNKRYTAGAYQIELTALSRANEQTLQMELAVTSERVNPEENPAAWARMQSLLNAMRLEDAAGRRWSSGGSGASGWDGSGFTATCNFHRGDETVGPPVRLIWELPTRVAIVTVPFEFTDVPLPAWE